MRADDCLRHFLQEKPKEAENPKPRKQVALLEDMADTAVTKPTTDFGARQQTAKNLMTQAQHKASQDRHSEAADLYARAEELYGACNDSASQQDAATKKQTALYQAQMDAKAEDAKRKAARASVNQGLRAMQENDDEGALNHFSSAEQTLNQMREIDAQVLEEIRRHKDEAADKVSRNARAKLAALQNVEKQQEDLANERAQELRAREAAFRTHEEEARKHELAARRMQSSVAAPGKDGAAGAQAGAGSGAASPPSPNAGKPSPPQGLNAEQRLAEMEAMKEKRRKEQEKKREEQRKAEAVHRKLYQKSVTTQLASALGLPAGKARRLLCSLLPAIEPCLCIGSEPL